MSIFKDGNGVIHYTQPQNQQRSETTGTVVDDEFAIIDETNVLKQIQFKIIPTDTNPGVITLKVNAGPSREIDLDGAGGGAVDSVNGQTGIVVLGTDDVAEGATNLYYTQARARADAVEDAINDGVIDIAPSENAVFDALATKQDTIGGLIASHLLVTNASSQIVNDGAFQISTEGGLQGLVTKNISPSDDPGFYKTQNFEVEFNPDGNSTSGLGLVNVAIDAHYDRTDSGGDLGSDISSLTVSMSHEGDGSLNRLLSTNINATVGNGSSTGHVDDLVGLSVGASVQTGASADRMSLLNLSIGNNGDLDQLSIINVGGNSDLSGNYSGISMDYTGTIGGSYTGARWNVQADVSQSMEMLLLGHSGTANSIKGLNVNLQGTYAQGGQGIQVSTANATATTGQMTALSVEGYIQAGVNISIVNSSVVQSGHIIGATTTVPSGSPASGTDLISNNLACLLLAQDNVSNGPIELGWTAVGFVGQVAVENGKTVEEVNMALGGASYPVQSTGGTITKANVYRAAGFFSAGGSLNFGTVSALKVDDGFKGFASEAYSVQSLDSDTKLYNAGEIITDTAVTLTDPGAGTNKVTLQAPTLSGDYTLTLPTDDGDADQFLKTDGSGVLSWADAGSAVAVDDVTIEYNMASQLTVKANSITPTYMNSDGANANTILVSDGANGANFTTEPVNFTGPNTITAGVGITFSGDLLHNMQQIAGSGATTITADPAIAQGNFAGQMLTLIGLSNSSTVTWDTDSGVKQNGPVTLGQYDSISYVYDGSLWIETGRS